MIVISCGAWPSPEEDKSHSPSSKVTLLDFAGASARASASVAVSKADAGAKTDVTVRLPERYPEVERMRFINERPADRAVRLVRPTYRRRKSFLH